MSQKIDTSIMPQNCHCQPAIVEYLCQTTPELFSPRPPNSPDNIL